MTPKQRKIELEKLAKSPQGEALKDLFLEKIAEMNDMSTVESWEDTLGRKLAIKTMRKIMKTLTSLSEDEKKSEKEDYR